MPKTIREGDSITELANQGAFVISNAPVCTGVDPVALPFGVATSNTENNRVTIQVDRATLRVGVVPGENIRAGQAVYLAGQNMVTAHPSTAKITLPQATMAEVFYNAMQGMEDLAIYSPELLEKASEDLAAEATKSYGKLSKEELSDVLDGWFANAIQKMKDGLFKEVRDVDTSFVSGSGSTSEDEHDW